MDLLRERTSGAHPTASSQTEGWIARARLYTAQPYFARYADFFARYVDAGPHHRVLDCGIGTGEPLALSVARAGSRVFGADIDPRLLQQCRDNACAEGVNVAIVTANLTRLPYQDRTFERVYCFSATWCIADLSAAVGEMWRVLRPGGILVFDATNLLHPSQFLVHQYWKIRTSRLVLGVRAIVRILNQKPVHDLLEILESRHWGNYPRTPFRLASVLQELSIPFETTGFFVFLPLSLPLLGDKGNLCKYSSLLSYGLRDVFLLKYWGAKLVYVCRKESYDPGNVYRKKSVPFPK